MNWNRIEGALTHFKGSVRQQWEKLTDEQIALRLYSRHNRQATPASFGHPISRTSPK